jgi:hypothetical protein
VLRDVWGEATPGPSCAVPFAFSAASRIQVLISPLVLQASAATLALRLAPAAWSLRGGSPQGSARPC